jgi:Flp pilus assembly protein TadD
MSNLYAGHRTARGAALIISTVVVACGGDAESQANTGAVPTQVALAEPTPAPTVDTAVTPQPRMTNVTYGDAERVFRQGSYTDAKELFGVVVEEHPTDGQSHYMLGLSAWKSGDHVTAERALRRAVEIDSQSVKARTNLGRVLLEQGRVQDALPHVEKAAELAPESYEVWRVLGNVKAELRRDDEALDAYRRALVRNEKDAWSMNNYALVLIQLGRYDEALPPLARAVELMPGSARFQNNLGIVLERNGLPGSARRAFTAALAADSTYSKAQVNLSRIDSVLGETEGETTELSVAAQMFVEQMKAWRASESQREW